MNPEQIAEAMWAIADYHSEHLSQAEYLDLLEQVASDAEIRAEAVRHEMNDGE